MSVKKDWQIIERRDEQLPGSIDVVVNEIFVRNQKAF